MKQSSSRAAWSPFNWPLRRVKEPVFHVWGPGTPGFAFVISKGSTLAERTHSPLARGEDAVIRP